MEIFWIKLDKLKYNIFLNELKDDLSLGKRNIVFTPNPEILLNTKKDKEFKNIINKATFLTSDWIWLYIWFQILENKKNIFLETLLLPYYFFNLFFRKNYLYYKYGDRICGSDMTLDLVKFSQENNISITILDPYYPKDIAKCESQKNFRKNLLKKFPKLNFNFFIYKPEEKEEIIKEIGKSESKILFSTLWMKTQEKSIIEIMNKCKNIKLGLGIWSSFDYLVWFQKRAPLFWRKIGLEWLYRLITWPQKIKRLKRLYKAIFVFILEVLLIKR